ncbi:MAG: hypothetical protein K2X29_08395 [Candidatus Obscuribacterales bacterium]|nr:hypothetical protein [Candidatus Obscuribacterales bacterium]
MGSEIEHSGEAGKKKSHHQPKDQAANLEQSDSPAAPSPWHDELAGIEPQEVKTTWSEADLQLEAERLLRFNCDQVNLNDYPILSRLEDVDRDKRTWGVGTILPEPSYHLGTSFLDYAFWDVVRKRRQGIPEEDKKELRQELSAILETQKKDLPEIRDCMKRQGRDPVETIVDAARKSNVVFVGEMHTLPGEPNPMREMGIAVLRQLPPGTRLAIEMPVRFKGAFDNFNKTAPDAKFELPIQQGDLSESEIELLDKVMHDNLGSFYQEAHRLGIQLVPIDSNVALESVTPSTLRERSAKRDSEMKDNVRNLLLQDPDHLVVVWGGDNHGADYKGQSGSKSMIEQLKEDKDLKDVKVTSFAGQSGSGEHLVFSLFVATEGIDSSVCVPTTENGKPNSIGNKQIMASEDLKPFFEKYTGDGNLTYSGFDNVIIFPRVKEDKEPVDKFIELMFQGR